MEFAAAFSICDPSFLSIMLPEVSEWIAVASFLSAAVILIPVSLLNYHKNRPVSLSAPLLGEGHGAGHYLPPGAAPIVRPAPALAGTPRIEDPQSRSGGNYDPRLLGRLSPASSLTSPVPANVAAKRQGDPPDISTSPT